MSPAVAKQREQCATCGYLECACPDPAAKPAPSEPTLVRADAVTEPGNHGHSRPWGQPGPELVKKIASAMARLDRVPKTGRNTFDNYDYATEADVSGVIQKAIAAEGLAVLPTVVDHTVWDAGATKSGTPQRGATVTLEITITDGETAFVSRWVGEAIDRGDKLYYKAYTGALKYALLKTFLVATGDDPEQESPEAAPASPTKQLASKVASGPRASKPAGKTAPSMVTVTPSTVPTAGEISALKDKGFEWRARTEDDALGVFTKETTVAEATKMVATMILPEGWSMDVQGAA